MQWSVSRFNYRSRFGVSDEIRCDLVNRRLYLICKEQHSIRLIVPKLFEAWHIPRLFVNIQLPLHNKRTSSPLGSLPGYCCQGNNRRLFWELSETSKYPVLKNPRTFTVKRHGINIGTTGTASWRVNSFRGGGRVVKRVKAERTSSANSVHFLQYTCHFEFSLKTFHCLQCISRDKLCYFKEFKKCVP